ncbi:hypothetical protein [Streptomyces sp. NPDC055794]
MTALFQILSRQPGFLVSALRLVPLIIICLCAVPAVVVLPFFPQGHKRAIELISHLKSWSLGEPRQESADNS